MHYFKRLAVLFFAVSGWMTSSAQVTDAQVPGDHFSLEGALELFKKSESPEEFERLLNSPDSKVNNLDLDGDGYIDYISVFDRNEGNTHVFILQAIVSESERQDIAVIELEKRANGKAVLQIVGNEDIYGIETIIEPTTEVRTYAGTTTTRTVVNVWSWPVVHYVYSPNYVVWHSPWEYHYHPMWWRPWRPIVYVHYYDYWRPYRPNYAVCHSRRVVYAHNIYHPHRRASVIVYNRHHDRVANYRSKHESQGYDNKKETSDKRYSRGSDHQRTQDYMRQESSSRDRESNNFSDRRSSHSSNLTQRRTLNNTVTRNESYTRSRSLENAPSKLSRMPHQSREINQRSSPMFNSSATERKIRTTNRSEVIRESRSTRGISNPKVTSTRRSSPDQRNLPSGNSNIRK